MTIAVGFLLALASPAHSRAPIRDCGDVDTSLSAITAQNIPCGQAVALARKAATKPACGQATECRAGRFTCAAGFYGELRFLRCVRESTAQIVRFEFGG